MGRGDCPCPDIAVSSHIPSQGLQFDIFPFALHREVKHSPHVLIIADKRHIIDRDGKNGLSQAVELFGDNLGIGCIVHPIIYLQRTALNAHLVVSLLGVVVVIIVLVGVGAEVIVAGKKHRCSEKVAVISVAVLRGKGHVELCVLNIGSLNEQFSKVVHLHAITQLFARDVDGAAVGELVFGIVKGVMVVALAAHGVLTDSCVAEVNGLICSAVAEEGGIALSSGLDYLVPHGKEVGTVLACCRIRLNNNAPQLVVYIGESGSVGSIRAVVHQMGYRVVKSVPRKVARYAYYVAHVVAFQFKHQLKVVAQVVVRFTESQRQPSLR